MPFETDKKERVRALLKKANVEIGAALARVDTMHPYELAEIGGAADSTRAFFDRQSVCDGTSLADPVSMPEFNTNDACQATLAISDANAVQR